MPLDVLDAASQLLRGAPQGERITPLATPLLVRLKDFVERFLDHHLEVRAKARGEFLAADDRNTSAALRTGPIS